jgi:type I restriction-modification system DNA methylase subunit
LHKRDKSKDVLEKVTLIKDIIFSNPHRAHIDILCDLSFGRLYEKHRFSNFVALHEAWQKTLDSSELNKRFFRDVANWYFWAIQNITFPKDAGEDEEVRNATSVIRLITRLIFVWFIKEKGLVPDDLFNKSKLDDILKFNNAKHSSYYKAILQNLFFATLNQEMNTPKKLDKRKFRHKAKKASGRDQHYMIHNVYRYESYFKKPDEAVKLFSTIPFLNGGLFECLDKPDKDDSKKILRIDGFSDHKNNELIVPDFLFFSEKQKVDLNESYGTKNKQYEVRGLIDIFERYKFTINENTPIEEEVALDPELLGKVFENLLAAYNPETGVTARKQTGSFYTPREIVDYMVGESLKASLSNLVAEKLDDSTKEDMRTGMDILFAYTEKEHAFNDEEVSKIVEAVSELKILDPACGSGAFPMGVLHKLVYILGKLDWDNTQWRELQKQRAIKETEEAYNMGNKEDRHQRLGEIEKAFDFNTSDYGRKLYLIENCIYGVDIQPIAAQIAKLRFFISLVVDQTINEAQENRGILPLPNLETNFVAANTLLNVEKPQQAKLINLEVRAEIDQKERELASVRRNHFTARTLKTKRKWRTRDAQLRVEISDLLKKEDFPPETTQKLAYWDPYDQNASANFFDSEWMFGISDGFDVVIGNPPYVRQEKIKELKPALKKQYDCYTSVADLYVYFYERGFQALKTDGILTYISSNKYFRSGYGKKLRKFLTCQATVHQLIDFGDASVFTSIAYPSIITLSKKNPDKNQTRALTWNPGPPIEEFVSIFQSDSFMIDQNELTADGWRLESTEVLRLLDKLRNAGKPLGKYVSGRFYRGILTGLNEAFVVDRATRDHLIAEHTSSKEVLWPFLRGRDVKRWRVNFDDQYLIKIESSKNRQHPWSGKPLKEAEKIFAETYPVIHTRFEGLRKKLMKRDDQGQYFWELRSCKYWIEFEQPKIVYPNICKRNEFAWDESGCYTNQKAFIIPRSSKYLLAVLNSSIVTWLFTKLLAKLQNGFYEPSTIFMKDFPIPNVTSKKQSPVAKLADNILTAKRADPNATATASEAEIDARVAHLYELTEEEYSLILNETKPPDPFRVAALNFYRDIAKGVLK